MSPREHAASKARRLLAEGRVTVVRAIGPEVDAVVRGDSSAIYRVQHRPGSWMCTCEALGLCSHVRGVMLVTAVTTPRLAAAIEVAT